MSVIQNFIERKAKEKRTYVTQQIVDNNGDLYDVVFDIKKDMIGLSYKDKNIDKIFTSYISISYIMANIQKQRSDVYELLQGKSENRNKLIKKENKNGY
jgi:hypothetical protein